MAADLPGPWPCSQRGGGLAALLQYRYIDIPAFGPFPAMYEPVWFLEKNLTALAETAAVLLATTALILPRRGSTKPPHSLAH